MMVRADREPDRKARILRSIPGVGPVVTLTFLACPGELGEVNGNQVGPLAGLAPFARDSGTAQSKRHIHGGRAQLRCSPYMAAL